MLPITDFLSCTDPLDEFNSLSYHQAHHAKTYVTGLAAASSKTVNGIAREVLPAGSGRALNKFITEYDWDEDGTDILEEVIDSVTHVYEHLPSPFAFSQFPYQHEHETTVTQQHLEKSELPDVYWLMILSPPICEDIGRERLKSAPVWRVDTLSDGSIRLVASGDGLKYRREDKQRLREHLGLSE